MQGFNVIFFFFFFVIFLLKSVEKFIKKKTKSKKYQNALRDFLENLE
jgi:hypothetical protein